MPELTAEAGWSAVWPFPFNEAKRSFTGPAGIEGLALKYFKRADGDLVAKLWLGRSTEGAPRRAHGGALLTVLDEAMGAAAWVAGLPVLTARLTTTFRRGAPLERELLIETRVTRKGGTTVKVDGRIVDADGVVYTEATGVFARISPDSIR